MTTNAPRRVGADSSDHQDQLPEHVDVDIAAGTVVFWDGAQRGGTITAVPRRLALSWLRRRWATCIHWA